ncbi:MAG TPA: amino acid ABC transporter substrate-binding protein [Ruminococcaceae bacterium]|nr:amino acid ABC transporter substrate-binding protein [Oscillospiraceae bacterium]
MKRKIALVLAAVLMLSVLAGCVGSEETVFISGAADLEGKIIGVQQGTTGESYVSDAENVKDAEVKSYKTPADAVLDLKNKRLDAIVIDEMPAKRLIENYSDLMILETPLTEEEYAIAVRKGETELVDQINATLKRIQDDGTYDTFLEAYITGTDTSKLPAYEPKGTESFKVGTSPDFPPFEMMGEKDEIIGFDVEICQEIADDMGKELEMVGSDFDSLILALTSGKVDIVMSGMSVTEERLLSVDFTDPYYSASQVIIVRKTSAEGGN